MKRVTGDEGGSAEWMFRRIIVEELVHGSSLFCQDEGEVQEGRVYTMHRLVRLFVVSDMDRGSEIWNEVYSFALVTVHECV